MKQTVCDSCGALVEAGAMWDGAYSLRTRWDSCGGKKESYEVEIKLNVTSRRLGFDFTRPVDLCKGCLLALVKEFPEMRPLKKLKEV